MEPPTLPTVDPTPTTDIHRLLDDAAQRLRAGEAAATEAACRRALALAPDAARAHWLLGAALALQGRAEEAVAPLTRATTLDPASIPARHNLVSVLLALGRAAEALRPVREMIAAGQADQPEIHRLHVRALSAERAWDEALAAADAGLAHVPDDDELVALRGSVLRVLGRPAASLAAQEAHLSQQPESVPAQCERGWALLALLRVNDALEAFDALLELEPPPLSALVGLGVAELQCGLHAGAVAAFDQVLAQDPSSFEGHYHRAVALQAMGRLPDARSAYAEVLRRWPNFADAYANLGSLERDSGNLDASVALQRQALTLAPQRSEAHSNLLLTLLYRPEETPESLAREHADWGARFGSPAGRYTDWPNDRDRDRPLRLGIVSAELCSHPVAAWLIPALASLDRRRFAILCYSTRRLRDAVTERIQPLVDGWCDATGLDDSQMAERIRAEQIDILIDITGHSAHNRLPVFALKPAPVQASWLGYPFTTGLPAIDYFIMDDVAVRPGEEAMFTEEVVRLPGGRFCYEPPSAAPAVVPPPALANGWVTFGSFNNLTKLTPEVLDVWFRIIERLPTARLVLKTPALAHRAAAERLRAAFCDRGLTAGRLELRPGSPQSELLAQYGDIDVALDPFPFGGGITSCEALWMGVPLITMPGWQPVSRQSETILRAIGQEAWVARDADDYVRIAVELARDPLRLADLRATQRETLRNSPICDQARIGRELGDAFRRMWQSFVTREAMTIAP